MKISGTHPNKILSYSRLAVLGSPLKHPPDQEIVS